MPSKIADDPRIDPRIKAWFGKMAVPPAHDVASRDELLAEMNGAAAKQMAITLKGVFDAMDNETVAPSAGLLVSEHSVVSQPDGNRINIRFVRPETQEKLPCVYYIHGGGMQVMSCYDGHYRAWARIIAAQGVAVAMVDFRNALMPSSVPEVAPFPAGLNDCISGLKWLHASSAMLNIDTSRIVVAGESGGGNLALATGLKLKRDGELRLIKGLYASARTSRASGRCRRTRRRLKTTASSWICTTTAARWPTVSRNSMRAIRWPGPALPPATMCAGCRQP